MTPSFLNILALLFPWIVLLAHSVFFRGKRRFLSGVLGIVGMYALLLLSVHVLNDEIDATLYSFDLNGDGVFSGEEITPAQGAAMSDWANDTGRAMAPITGAIFSFLYVALVFLLWSIASWVVLKVRGKRSSESRAA